MAGGSKLLGLEAAALWLRPCGLRESTNFTCVHAVYVYADQTRKVRKRSVDSTCHRSCQALTCAYMHAYICVHTCLRTHAHTRLPVSLLCLCTSQS